MKYLKPELLERCRSLDDDVAEAASEEWDRAIARYNAELAAIRPQFPAGVRAVLDRFSLHDGRVLSILWGTGKLSLVIRLEGSAAHPGRTVELIYTLSKRGWTILKRGSVEPWSKSRGRIQYDEFGKAVDARAAVFMHSILLAGGRELRIRFTDLHVRLLKKVILPAVEPAGLGSP
jgi:hypothetical protein